MFKWKYKFCFILLPQKLSQSWSHLSLEDPNLELSGPWLGYERKLKQVINKIKNLYLTNPFGLCEFAFSLATELRWWGINWEKGITVIDRGIGDAVCEILMRLWSHC